MKFRRHVKTSTTFKTHFFSAFCRATFTNTCFIFVNSVFVKSVGGKNYSQLFFIASLFTLVYYVYFALRGDKKAYGVYKLVMGLALIASCLCFLEPFWPVLEPYNEPLLYFFSISVMVVDLVGTTVGPVVLQLSVNPAIFREVYQKIVTSELMARILSAAMVWALSAGHLLVVCYPIAWIALIAHIILFNVMIRRLIRVEEEEGLPEISARTIETVKKSMRFIFTNPMVRLATTIMIWSYITKFVADYLFFQVADETFEKARQVASFVSATTMTMILLSLIAQHTFSKRLLRRLQLSTLYSFQPFNVLIFGCLALVWQPFWPLVMLQVTCNVINRTIQLPISRQCMVPIPRAEKSTIVSLISILMSVATILATGILTALKDYMVLQDFLIILIVLGAGIFFMTTGLDSYYIRNLWSFYREKRSGRWQDEPVQEGLSSVRIDPHMDAPDGKTTPTANLRSHSVLSTYASSFDRLQLAVATREHKGLVSSDRPDMVLLGLKICFVTGFPWFEQILNDSLAHRSSRVRKFTSLAVQVNSYFKNIQGYSSVFRRRIKWLALEMLEQQPEGIEPLKNLLELPDKHAAEAIVAAMSDSRFTEYRRTLLSCIGFEKGRTLDLSPLIDRMFSLDYESASVLRLILERLTRGRENLEELYVVVETNLSALSKEKLALWTVSPEHPRDSGEFTRFMHTLFLEELRLCPRHLDRTLTDTIKEFPALSPEDSLILVDMHLEFLKRSDLLKKWQVVLA